jgi:uncharacterized protein (TIGR03643 family)
MKLIIPKVGFTDMKNLIPSDISRIIEMAWEDRTPFEAIEFQFGLKENDVREIMRSEMKLSSFKMWRKRASGRKTKHLSLRSKKVKSFKSKNQQTDFT